MWTFDECDCEHGIKAFLEQEVAPVPSLTSANDVDPSYVLVWFLFLDEASEQL